MSSDIETMSIPVRCRWCSGVYDLGAVEVTARYADCSVWKTPCCDNTADDRGETGWKSFADYDRIPKNGERRAHVNKDGLIVFGGRFPWEARS